MVAQMSLFSRAELAGMRDRTLARNYSAEREEFRREHERHRAWGLRQRHARKLVRAGWGAAAAWEAVTVGEDRQHEAASVIAATPQPADPEPSALAPVAVPSGALTPGETPSPQPAPGPPTAASPQPAPGRRQAGLFIVLVSWCVMVVEVALDKVGCRRVHRGHRAVVQLRATSFAVFGRVRKASGARGPPTFLVPLSTLGPDFHRHGGRRLAAASLGRRVRCTFAACLPGHWAQNCSGSSGFMLKARHGGASGSKRPEGGRGRAARRGARLDAGRGWTRPGARRGPGVERRGARLDAVSREGPAASGAAGVVSREGPAASGAAGVVSRGRRLGPASQRRGGGPAW
ncbi:hypothetical protein BXY51_000232 [Actinoplanes cyaneus]|nr:hypothetical protein [Actinoplanes cyaneus]